MADGFIKKTIEFLLGFFLVPIIVGLIGVAIMLFVIPSLGIASNESQFIYYSQLG